MIKLFEDKELLLSILTVRKKLWWLLFIAFIFVIVALFCIHDSSDECCLCNSTPYHAPVLVNLSTGEILELAVYDTDPFRPGELAEEQQTGTFSFIRGAGASGYRERSKYVKVAIPIESTRLDKRYFCKECRTMLNGCRGFVLADLRNTSDPIIYQLMECEISFRCYEIDIRKAGKKYEIWITGLQNGLEVSKN